MGTMSVSQARARFSDVVDQARVGHEPVYLTRRDRPVVALVDAAELERLEAAARSAGALDAGVRRAALANAFGAWGADRPDGAAFVDGLRSGARLS